jgi:hypothetical protein
MSPRSRLGWCLLVVGGLFIFHVHLKTQKIFQNPTWDAQYGVGQFWSECAFQYRFAKFFAEHPVRDWRQLGHDRAVQYPDTVNDWSEFTVAMEVPVGVLYRWVRPAMPFHVFVVWYDCLVSSLSLFAIFFLARALWRSNTSGVLATAFYATLYPSYGRTVKNLFLREDFAIPLILLALFFTVRAMQEPERSQPAGSRRQIWNQILAALAWLAALASWHLTQFVLAVGIGAAVLVWLSGRMKAEPAFVPQRGTMAGRGGGMKWFVLTLTVGGLLIPVLRVKQFYLSPMMCALYALALTLWIGGGRKKLLATFLGSAAVLVAISLLLRKSYGEYAHVYQLFFYKLRFLGVKPENPAALPWDARCLWEGAFNTADWSEFWRSLQWCGPLAVAAMMMVWNDRRQDARATNGNRGEYEGGSLPPQQRGAKGDQGMESADAIFMVFTVLLALLAWMVVRYFTFLGFAAAVMAAGIGRIKDEVHPPLATPKATKGGRMKWLGTAVCLGAIMWQLVAIEFRPQAGVGTLRTLRESVRQVAQLDFSPLSRAPVVPADYKPVVRWLNDNTPTNAVVLANISESPVFLACTGRPIILHSKFENREIRERYREFLEAIYSDEDRFFAFATKYGADYFVCDGASFLMATTESRRYKANRLGPLDANCAATLFVVAPQQLRHFEREFATERFTVFRVRR